jgi:hypothetical protein
VNALLFLEGGEKRGDFFFCCDERLLFIVAGKTPMLVALEYEEGKRNIHVVRYLLAHGTDPAMPDARGYPSLHNVALVHFRDLSWNDAHKF